MSSADLLWPSMCDPLLARTKTFCRWWQLWRPEARAGWTALDCFKVWQQHHSASHLFCLLVMRHRHGTPLAASRPAAHMHSSTPRLAGAAAPDTLLTRHLSSTLPATIFASASECKFLSCRSSSGTFWST